MQAIEAFVRRNGEPCDHLHIEQIRACTTGLCEAHDRRAFRECHAHRQVGVTPSTSAGVRP